MANVQRRQQPIVPSVVQPLSVRNQIFMQNQMRSDIWMAYYSEERIGRMENTYIA
jgi:hypothetical protein